MKFFSVFGDQGRTIPLFELGTTSMYVKLSFPSPFLDFKVLHSARDMSATGVGRVRVGGGTGGRGGVVVLMNRNSRFNQI